MAHTSLFISAREGSVFFLISDTLLEARNFSLLNYFFAKYILPSLLLLVGSSFSMVSRLSGTASSVLMKVFIFKSPSSLSNSLSS